MCLVLFNKMNLVSYVDYMDISGYIFPNLSLALFPPTTCSTPKEQSKHLEEPRTTNGAFGQSSCEEWEYPRMSMFHIATYRIL